MKSVPPTPRLLCPGDPSGSRSFPGFWIPRSTVWEEMTGLVQGKEIYEDGLGPGCPTANLFSDLGAKGKTLDPWSE